MLQRKLVYLGANKASFQEASEDLKELLELSISPKQIERLTTRIGGERLRERKAAVEAFQRLPLVQKDAAAHPDCPVPPVAMASMDGGRLQIRSTKQTEQEPADERNTHWRESKVGVLETYGAQSFESDPDPDVPRCFLDLGACAKLASGLGHALPAGLEPPPQGPEEGAEASGPPKNSGAFRRAPSSRAKRHHKRRSRKRSRRPGCPERLVRSAIASRSCSEEFGPMLQQAAWERNFFASPRRAFLGDGLACNWTVQRKHFPTFVPILDFVHALSYVFAAAMAGRSEEEGSAVYRRWIQQIWAGQVNLVLPELEQRAAELGPPAKTAPTTDPSRLVAEALCYLSNNAGRMRYDEYRRLGLPIMTSAVESMIKRINRRVKGSEKFWSEAGAEAVLQLRADYLSETSPMDRFWKRRENNPTGARYRRQAA